MEYPFKSHLNYEVISNKLYFFHAFSNLVTCFHLEFIQKFVLAALSLQLTI